MDVYVKNGTPLNGPSLCETCTQALIVRGYRESDEVVVCQATYPERRVKFPVRECSRFIDKTRQHCGKCIRSLGSWLRGEANVMPGSLLRTSPIQTRMRSS